MSESEKKPERVSEADRAHMRKIGEAKRRLALESKPPASLAEMFARMEEIEARLGRLARAGVPGGEFHFGSIAKYAERRGA